MMSAFYDDPDHVLTLLREVDRWDGTRYSRLGAAPGPRGGVGCVRYTIALHAATGAMPEFAAEELPVYQDDWSAHNRESLLDQWLARLGFITLGPRGGIKDGPRSIVIRDPKRLRIGDILVMAPGHCTHHLATFLGTGSDGDEMTQSRKPTGVETVSLNGLVLVGNRPRRPIEWFAYAIRITKEGSEWKA
jgi:hypothetical protein